MITITSGLAVKLQSALYKAGYFPGLMTSVFDENTVNQLDAYWRAKGFALPTSADEAQLLLSRSFMETGVQDPAFTVAEMVVLSQGYASARNLGIGGWFKKNWMWVAGGVVVIGGAVGGYYWYQKSQEGGGTNGLGCGCALGHGGRTTSYSFPGGTKHGHYSKATGRFHSHY